MTEVCLTYEKERHSQCSWREHLKVDFKITKIIFQLIGNLCTLETAKNLIICFNDNFGSYISIITFSIDIFCCFLIYQHFHTGQAFSTFFHTQQFYSY